MPKSAAGAEGCLLGDGVKPESMAGTTLVAKLQFESGTGSLTSARQLPTLCPVLHMLVPVLFVLNLLIPFAAAADDLGW